MAKKKMKVKRIAAILLAAIVLMESNSTGISMSSVLAKEPMETSVSSNEPEVITGGFDEEEKSTGEFGEEAEEESTVSFNDVEIPPEETGDFVFAESTDEVLRAASASLENTETKKVAVDPTSIAQTQVYKDMDYSFLKEYRFGQSNEEQAKVTFGSAEELKKSNDIRLVAGKIIKTEGYYESGDGGNAVYKILSESDMWNAGMVAGAIQLPNGLYACILPDVYEIGDEKWGLVNILQFGAKGDGVISSQGAISQACSCVSKYAAQNEDISRGIVYMPAGEYKCDNELVTTGLTNVNIVGDGDSTVLFTDNDYRVEQGYSEFFFAVWNSQNVYFGDFRIEAREVDLYHYMRQFVLIYCDNIYVYNVNLIVPQEAYSGYYYEDKQYSNFCCYSGDTNITVDGCTMVQFSGTYRGANVGILDFWDREVKNITVMNCDLYSNARDEQIGIFNIPKTGSKINENTSISNIDLINNAIHTIPVKYTEVVGNQNMCFTVAYGDSVRIDDVRIAGNHFICEADSKFMTFGTITNCVFEENIIELIATRTNGASVFDSSNQDAGNIIIRNNEFFLTSLDGKRGKVGFMQGKMTFEGNKVFSDTVMPFAVVGQVAKNNEFVFLEPIGTICGAVNQVEENTYYLYGGTNSKDVFSLSIAGGCTQATVKNNTVYDYGRSIGARSVWDALVTVSIWDDKEIAEFRSNKYYAPNKKYTYASHYSIDNEKEDVDWIEGEDGKKQITAYYNRLFYLRGPDNVELPEKKVIFENNILQGVKGYVDYNKPKTTEYVVNNNTTLPYREDLSEEELLVSNIDILYNNEKVTEVAVTKDTVNLDKIVQVAARDEEGNILSRQEAPNQEIKWYTSVESMATVTEDGTVTRKMYGDVTVYAVPTDGSGIYGKCTIHFLKDQATSLNFTKETVDLQPGLKYYADYTVLPKEAPQNLKWTSSNEAVATVSTTGLITANSVGKAVITGTTTDGSNISGSIEVQVTPVTVKKMTMDNTWLYFAEEQIGESKQLAIKEYTPENATNKTVKRWESSDSSVAVVDNQGKVTAVGSGSAEIRAYSTDEYCYALCKVYVQPSKVTNFRVTSILKNKITLSWEPVEKCHGYYLYQWDASASAWTQLNGGRALGQNITSYTVGDLTADTEYKFCIRSYYWNSSTGTNPLYESKDSIVTAKTYSYTPVTYIKGDAVSIVDNKGVKKGNFTVTYNKDADYSNLEFECKIQDESIAKIISFEDGSNVGEKNIAIEGLKYGMTTLTITSNDEAHASVQIPIGVMVGQGVSNCTAEAVYKQITINFDGLEDESNIDGYLVELVDGYRFNYIAFIKKTGQGTYSYVDKNVDVGETAGPRGNGYTYTVTPCLTDGSSYLLGKRVRTNGERAVYVPEPIVATSIQMGQEQYVVAGEDTIEVSVKVGNEDASTSEMYWEISNESYAAIERTERADGEVLTDYAKITGISAGVTKVKAVATDGSELEASAKLIVAPPPVKNIKAESDLTNVSLSWSGDKNANGYEVYRWDEKKKAFQLAAETKENYFQDLNLEANTAYRYKIIGYICVDGVKYEGKSTPEIGVATASSNYGIYATGYRGYYDGNSHKAVTLTGVKQNTDTVTYSIDQKNWSATVPTVTQVKDSRNIYVKVEREGQKTPYQITVAATVLACPVGQTDISLKSATIEWNGKKHTPEVVSKTCMLGKDYKVSGIKAYKNIGTYSITVTGTGNYTGTKVLAYKIAVVKGHKYTVSGYIYKVTGSKTVSVTGITNKKKTSVTVKSTVKIGGKTYKVTAIAASAFKNCKKLKKATIGKYVTSIGKNAFYGDKKLKKIVIKTKSLKKVGKNALKGIVKTAQIQVPKSKKTKYKKLFKKSTGYVSTMNLK